ncbi:hypothetical protein [Larkinella harenae]
MESNRGMMPFLHRLLCLLMAFHVINLSIDAPDDVRLDMYGQYAEDESFNEMESVGELVLEEWLGFSNIIPEHADPDENSHLPKPFFNWMLSSLSILYPIRWLVGYALLFIAMRPIRLLSKATEVIALPPELLPAYSGQPA